MSQIARQINKFLGQRWVMVVEPTANYRNSLKAFLANLKVTRIKHVSNVKEAYRELLTTQVGLFIVEWDLPEINGVQFCREIKREPNYANVPLLLVTVENMRHDVILASEVGIDGYLLKPFSYEDFVDAVGNIVKSQEKPSKVNALIAKAFDILDEGDFVSSTSLFEQALDENPNSARALCGLAKVSVRQGELEKAVAIYKRAIKVNTNYVDAYRELLEIYLKTGPIADLYEMAKIVNELSPSNPKYTIILAKAALEMDHIDESEAYFKKTIRLSPKLAEAYKGLGNVNMIQEDYLSAMKNFKKSLDLDNKDVSVINSLGLTYVKLGRIKDGIDKYRAALKIRPNDPRILFNLAYAYEKLGDEGKAAFYYRSALSYDPEFKKAARRLTLLLEKAGKNLNVKNEPEDGFADLSKKAAGGES